MTDKTQAALESTLTCPHCGQAQRESMPLDYCLYFYSCSKCETTLRPLQGDCCVFCSYGDTPCPPKQLSRR